MLAVLLVFITPLIEFKSFAHPVAIVTGAVLVSGVLFVLFVTGQTLNVVANGDDMIGYSGEERDLMLVM